MSNLKRKTSAKESNIISHKKLRIGGVSSANTDHLKEIENIREQLIKCADEYDAGLKKLFKKNPFETVMEIHSICEQMVTTPENFTPAMLPKVRSWTPIQDILAEPWYLKPYVNKTRDLQRTDTEMTDASVGMVSVASSMQSTSQVPSTNAELESHILRIQSLACEQIKNPEIDATFVWKAAMSMKDLLTEFNDTLEGIKERVAETEKICKEIANGTNKADFQFVTETIAIQAMECANMVFIRNQIQDLSLAKDRIPPHKRMHSEEMNKTLTDFMNSQSIVEESTQKLLDDYQHFRKIITDNPQISKEHLKYLLRIYDSIIEFANYKPGAEIGDLPPLPPNTLAALEAFRDFLKKNPFTPREWGVEWKIKRVVMSCLDEFVKLSQYDECLEISCDCVRLLFSGMYIHSLTDAKNVVEAGIWKPLVKQMASRKLGDEDCRSNVYVLLHLADHTDFYEDYIGVHDDFWDNRVMLTIFGHVLHSILVIPNGFDYDMYEQLTHDCDSVIKMFNKWVRGNGVVQILFCFCWFGLF